MANPHHSIGLEICRRILGTYLHGCDLSFRAFKLCFETHNAGLLNGSIADMAIIMLNDPSDEVFPDLSLLARTAAWNIAVVFLVYCIAASRPLGQGRVTTTLDVYAELLLATRFFSALGDEIASQCLRVIGQLSKLLVVAYVESVLLPGGSRRKIPIVVETPEDIFAVKSELQAYFAIETKVIRTVEVMRPRPELRATRCVREQETPPADSVMVAEPLLPAAILSRPRGKRVIGAGVDLGLSSTLLQLLEPEIDESEPGAEDAIGDADLFEFNFDSLLELERQTRNVLGQKASKKRVNGSRRVTVNTQSGVEDTQQAVGTASTTYADNSELERPLIQIIEEHPFPEQESHVVNVAKRGRGVRTATTGRRRAKMTPATTTDKKLKMLEELEMQLTGLT
jgi:hypothetical protein